MRKIISGCRRYSALTVFFTCAFFVQRTDAQPAPVFVYGAEPTHVPNEMQPVSRTWHPVNQLQEPGIKHGPPFEAALVRVFNEDTLWTSEMAVFRFGDGTVRAWKSRSFSAEDRAVMREMKAKSPAAPVDLRTWTTKLDDQMQKLVEAKTLNKYETRHFVFIWGTNPDADVKDALNSPQFIEKAGEWCEKVWTAYEVDFRAPMPWEGDSHPQRILVKLYGTGIPGVGKGWANSAREMALNPRGMFHGSTVIGHEFCHVANQFSISFGGRSKDDGAKWRLTLVAVGKNNVARYSPRVTAAGKTGVTLGMQVKQDEEYVLSVAATPAKYRSLTWDQTPEFDYPYALRASGASFSTPDL